MKQFALGLTLALGIASTALGQGPGHAGNGAPPGFQNGLHFGNGLKPGPDASPVPFTPAAGRPGANAQTGTGRLGGDTIPGYAVGSPFAGGKSGGGRSHSLENRNDGRTDRDESADGKPRKDPKHDPRDQAKLTGPARALQERLAAIDHMRDMALRSGNTRLLEEADTLEAMARQQFEFQMEHGNRSSGSGVPVAPQGRVPRLSPPAANR